MARVVSYVCDHCGNAIGERPPRLMIQCFEKIGLDIRPVNFEGETADLCPTCLVKALEVAEGEVSGA